MMFGIPEGSSSHNCFPSCTSCITVRIADDDTVEEQFEDCMIALSNSDSTGVLFAVSSTRIVIQDDDSECWES